MIPARDKEFNMSSSTSPKPSGGSTASLTMEDEAKAPETASETDRPEGETAQTVKDDEKKNANHADREATEAAESAEAKPADREGDDMPAGAKEMAKDEGRPEMGSEGKGPKAEAQPEDTDARADTKNDQASDKQSTDAPAETKDAPGQPQAAEAEAAKEDAEEEPEDEEPLDLRALFASSEPEFADPADTFELARGAKPDSGSAPGTPRPEPAADGAHGATDDESDFPFDLPADGMLNVTPTKSEPARNEALTDIGGDTVQGDDVNTFGGTPGDPLADAVQSALRSVYGDDEKGENHGYTRDDMEGDASGPILQWAGAAVPENAEDPPAQAEDFEAEPDDPRQDSAAIDEETTEAVLSYLYEHIGDETHAPAEPTTATDGPADPTDLANDDPEDLWAAVPEPAETRIHGAHAANYTPTAPAQAYAPESAPGGGQTVSAASEETFHPPIDVSAGDSEASGKLLGAAGLGLIGGIAAAGVAAVFVFNSFVTQQEPGTVSQRPSSAKVEETATSAPQRAALASDTGQDKAAEATLDRSTAGSATDDAGQPAPAQPRADTPSDTAQTAAVPELNPPETPSAEDGSSVAATGPSIEANPVSGRANEAIPLELTVPGGEGERFVRITGLPDGVKLSAGVDTGNGSWLLSAGRANNLTLTVPDGFAGVFTLDAQLLGTDARTPLSEDVAFEVDVAGVQVAEASETRTAAVGADTSPAASEPSLSPVERAENLLRDGDVRTAREILRAETETGSATAALVLGTSYDPRTFTGLTSANASPDATEAFRWYQRAAELGDPNGSSQISELKAWLLR
jgi:hypothetical protein